MGEQTPMDVVVRSIQDNEVEKWIDFVTDCFAVKGTPRSHFSSHYYLDPARRCDWILVAHSRESDGAEAEFASSLRIFDRKILIHATEVKAGCIGEVCTKDTYRRKGLCKRVLSKALNVMRRDGCHVSCLHSSEMSHVYRSVGFRTIVLSFVGMDFCQSNIDHEYHASAVDVSTPPNPEVLSAYRFFAARFNGCFVRDDASYWSTYLDYNTKEGSWAIYRREGAELKFAAMMRWKKDRDGQGYTVSDFFADKMEVERDSGAKAFAVLIQHILREKSLASSRIKVPKPLADSAPGIISPDDKSCFVEEDVGQMYCALTELGEQMLNAIETIGSHVAFGVDGF